MDHEQMIKGLRRLCGYVENGTDTVVRIFQDDATKDWIVKVDNHYRSTAPSMELALIGAIQSIKED